MYFSQYVSRWRYGAGIIISALALSGCADREDDWLKNWPVQAVPQNVTPVKGLGGEKHHF